LFAKWRIVRKLPSPFSVIIFHSSRPPLIYRSEMAGSILSEDNFMRPAGRAERISGVFFHEDKAFRKQAPCPNDLILGNLTLQISIRWEPTAAEKANGHTQADQRVNTFRQEDRTTANTTRRSTAR